MTLAVHPVLAWNNSTGRARARFTAHLKIGKAIKLLSFSTFPDEPGVQVAELAMGEGAKRSALSRAANCHWPSSPP